jgi:hypothetical protein
MKSAAIPVRHANKPSPERLAQAVELLRQRDQLPAIRVGETLRVPTGRLKRLVEGEAPVGGGAAEEGK